MTAATSEQRMKAPSLGTEFSNEYIAELRKQGLSAEEINKRLWTLDREMSFMVRGDTKGNEIMVGDHVEGLGFVRNVAIDQHLLKRNRQFDLLEVVDRHPNLLGIGLDEDTAIVVRGDQFEVIGQSYVLIYDNQRQIPPHGKFHFLAPGDQYDLQTRKALRPSRTMNPIERVVEQKWPRDHKWGEVRQGFGRGQEELWT